MGKQVAPVGVAVGAACSIALFTSKQGASSSTQVLTQLRCACLRLPCVSLDSLCCALTAAAGVLAATGILTGVYYATPKETKDKIRRRVKKTTDE
jgi:hypothetical protein